MIRKKIDDVTLNAFTGGGIFTALAAFNVPWKNDVQGVLLDTEYYGNVSGMKTISPLVNKVLGDNVALSAQNTEQLASVIYALYHDTWTKEYATLNFEYNPIENYNMEEVEHIDREHDNTVTNTGTQSNAVTRTNTGTQTNAGTRTNTGTQTDTGTKENTGTQTVDTDDTITNTGEGHVDNDVWAFNSPNAVNDTNTATDHDDTIKDDKTETRTDDLIETEDRTRTDNLTQTDSYTRTDNLSESSSDTRTDNLVENDEGTEGTDRTLTRTGNIGVTTSQQMIQSERDLYMWNFFFNVVFPNVDRVLTIATYSAY